MADKTLETIQKVVEALDSALNDDKKDDKKGGKKDSDKNQQKDSKKNQQKDQQKDSKKDQQNDQKKDQKGSQTGTQKGSKKDDKKAEKKEDKITYQKMIPAFRFEVSFLKEEKKADKKEDSSPVQQIIDAFGNIISGIKGDKKDKEKDKSNDSEAAPMPFSDVSGLSLEIQTEDFTEGGGNDYVIRLPKPPKPRNLVLKRALSAAPPEIVEWAQKAVEQFVFEPRTLVVSIIDYESQPVKTWNFEGAYPVKLSLSDLSASKSEIVIETLEIAYRKVSLVKKSSS